MVAGIWTFGECWERLLETATNEAEMLGIDPANVQAGVIGQMPSLPFPYLLIHLVPASSINAEDARPFLNIARVKFLCGFENGERQIDAIAGAVSLAWRVVEMIDRAGFNPFQIDRDSLQLWDSTATNAVVELNCTTWYARDRGEHAEIS